MTENYILDPNVTEYRTKRKAFDYAITDEMGNELGKLKSDSLFDNDDSLILELNDKLFGRGIEIRNSDGDLLRIVKDRKNGLIIMENPKGEEILLGEDSITGIPVGVNDGTGKEVASTVSKLKWHILPIAECTLHIKDKSQDRKTILGFWLALTKIITSGRGSVD